MVSVVQIHTLPQADRRVKQRHSKEIRNIFRFILLGCAEGKLKKRE
jgi:hypothetical protein